MQRALFVLAMWTCFFTGISCAQEADAGPTILVREVHFKGEPGGTLRQLNDYTEFLVGHRGEQKAVLQEASSAVMAFLRHRGFLKARVTPQARPVKTFGTSKENTVTLEITIEAGNRYRIQDVKFTGLSRELQEADLKQACNFATGDVADGEEIGNCVGNLRGAYKKNGEDVVVVPNMTFDEARSTVVLIFDIGK